MDASGTAYAGILSQQWKDGWHPIAYFSRKFSGPELHYPVYDKELMAIVMSFRQWRHYLEGVPEIEVWSDHANLKRFMSQTVLNGRQARWLIQLAPYDFTIQYRRGTLNPADGPSRRPDYMTEQGEGRHGSAGKPRGSSPKQSRSTPRCVGSSPTSKLTPWRVGDLIPTLANKLATAALGAGGQYSCNIRGTDPEAESLIRVLSLQATTRSKARLAADDLVPYSEASSLSQGTVPSGISTSEENSSILSLIKDAQEFDPQCRRISSQLRGKPEGNPPFALHGDGILKKADRVYIPHQEAIRNRLLELYHDCPSGGNWGRDKTLQLVQCHFTWNEISDDIHEYIATCPVCQGKAIHHHRPYGQ